MRPPISIVTPSYNQGRFIERTIQSVISQGVPGLEYVVFDGGSTDDTVSILKRYSEFLRWVSERDQGQSDAVNRGIRSSSGEIIGWLNSDDIYYPGALQTVASIFAENPLIDVLYGSANHINEVDELIETYPVEPWSIERLYQTCFICQPAAFVRRSVVERWGMLDEKLHYCMDYEFWLRLGRGGARFMFVSQVLAGSRFYTGTKTLGAKVKVHAEINSMLHDLIGRTPTRWLFNYAHALADDWGISRSKRLLHLLAITVISPCTSLRWNRRVSRDMAKEICGFWFNALRSIWERP